MMLHFSCGIDSEQWLHTYSYFIITKGNKTSIIENEMQIWNIVNISMTLCTDIFLLGLNIAIDNIIIISNVACCMIGYK